MVLNRCARTSRINDLESINAIDSLFCRLSLCPLPKQALDALVKRSMKMIPTCHKEFSFSKCVAAVPTGCPLYNGKICLYEFFHSVTVLT